ncbi:MAG: hypothetical protein KA184_20615 [Candidatus Hydrogenedentes bacterium]|nr:hypothetical protein [Candidatus Hydrogenedentota bacterium]
MTKIYEALDNASRERTQSGPRRGGAGLAITVSKPLEDKLLSLYQRIEAGMPGPRGPLVEVVGAHPGEEGARVARQFAKLAAARMGKRVLLLGAVGPALATEATSDWLEMAANGELHEDAFRIVGESNLCVSQMASNTSTLASVLAAPGLQRVLEEVRQQFDMTVVVAPALGASPEGYQLASIVDGVVVVVEAGKTRWQACKREIARMQAQGAKVLGIILNKRRYYIPNFVYRRI